MVDRVGTLAFGVLVVINPEVWGESVMSLLILRILKSGEICMAIWSMSGCPYTAGSFRSCVYAPNDPRGRLEFFSDLWRHAFPGIPLFLGGHFNCIESLKLDKAGGDALAGDKGSVELKDFADSVSICDVFITKFLTRKLFTRHKKSNTNMSRIDRIYAPKDMISDAFGYILLIRLHILITIWCLSIFNVNRRPLVDLVFGNLILV